MTKKNIDRLIEAVTLSAKYKADSIKREVDSAEKTALNHYRASLLRSAAAAKRRSESRAADVSAEDAATDAAEIRRSLYRHRDELADKVFTAVEREVRDFCDSPAYKDRLIALALEAKAALPPAEEGVLYLRRADGEYLSCISEATGMRAELTESITLGGVLCTSPSLICDLTFDAGLAEAREAFAAESGLDVG